MEPSHTAPPHAEDLADPQGQPLGRVLQPRPGPVIGRARGTVYLIRQPGVPLRPSAAGETRYTGR